MSHEPLRLATKQSHLSSSPSHLHWSPTGISIGLKTLIIFEILTITTTMEFPAEMISKFEEFPSRFYKKGEVERLQVIPPENKDVIKIIRKTALKQGTRFEDHLTYNVEEYGSISVDSMVFRTRIEEGGIVTGLDFILLGSNIQCDQFFRFSIVTQVSFSGHVSYLTPAFRIIAQLNYLKSVSFDLNQSQLPFFLEKIEDNPINLPRNVSVSNLSVTAGFDTDCHLTNRILEFLFSRVGMYLPCIKYLFLQIPPVTFAKNLFLHILRNFIRSKTLQSLSFSLPYNGFAPSLMCTYKSTANRWLMQTNILDFDYSSAVNMLPEDKELYENHCAKEIIEAAFDTTKPTLWLPSKISDLACDENHKAHPTSEESKQSSPHKPESLDSSRSTSGHSYLQAFLGYHFPTEETEQPFHRVIIPCTNEGRDLKGLPETLRKLGQSVCNTRHYYQQYTDTN